MRFAGAPISSLLLTLAGVLGLATPAGASELCPPTAILSGPGPLVQELTRALVERGVRVEPAGLPPGDCKPLVVELTASDGLFGVSIADAWGRTAERTVKDPATAATLIESWARMDLLDGATTTSSVSASAAASPPPPLKNAQPETPTQKMEPTALAAAAPSPTVVEKTSLFRLSAEGGMGKDGLRWIGLAGSACARLGPVCLGMKARYGISQERQNAVDGLAVLDLPLVFGRVSLTPGVGVGVGWLSGRDQGFGAFGHQDDAGLAPRAELHLMASVRLSERLSLELGAAGTVAPSFGHHRELMGDSHLAIVRGQAGLVWGIP